MEELLGDFIEETNEGIAHLDVELVEWEKNPQNERLLSDIFRVMHTIKGSCGFIGLPRLEGLAHAAEDVLGKARSGKLAVTREHVSIIFKTLDRIRGILHTLETKKVEPEGQDEDLIKSLQSVSDQHISVSKPHNATVTSVPKENNPAPVVEEKSVNKVLENASSQPPIAAQTVRVKVDYLEDLMTTMSELVLTRNQLLQLGRNEKAFELTEPLQRLNSITSELQEQVMRARMQPIKNAWTKLPRLVRDLSVTLNKDIHLQMLGEETELDRQVLEIIQDPLMHMVRNSIDHGLESEEERLAAGKPAAGTITLNAYHHGGYIMIEISDDGRGLNTQKIKDKAIAIGIETPESIAGLSENEIYALIMRPGFSTADEVTSVSGRGVGMDVVQKNIERIGGRITLQSEVGKGMKLIFKIPLTLAIVSALIVETAEQSFAIPQLGIDEIVLISESTEHKIDYISDVPVLRLRDHLLPLISLKRVLALEQVEERRVVNVDSEQGSYVIVSQIGHTAFGLLVDKILNTEEIVVKPVASILKDISVFSGNTILGNGRIVMILDMDGLAKYLSAEKVEAVSGQHIARINEPAQKEYPFLTFTVSGGSPMAVKLENLVRLERIDVNEIEHQSDDTPIIQYRGGLLPLITFDNQDMSPFIGYSPLLVLQQDDHLLGLLVDKINDIVHTSATIDTQLARPGILGSVVIQGLTTEVIDHHTLFLNRWPKSKTDPVLLDSDPHRVVLLMGKSDYNEQMLQPYLNLIGYDVKEAHTTEEIKEILKMEQHLIASFVDMDSDASKAISVLNQLKEETSLNVPPVIALSNNREKTLYDSEYRGAFYACLGPHDHDGIINLLESICAAREEGQGE